MELQKREYPHRRYNPLTGEWVQVSPHRAKRPWLGQVEKISAAALPAYDPDCYLCPGNVRANGQKNAAYEKTFVFVNDFSALLPETEFESESDNPLFRSQAVHGSCRVVCFSPRHDLTLAQMEPEDISGVVKVWMEQVEDLGKTYPWVQVFENRGAVMGCSNPHPHCQIWALDEIPNEPYKEDQNQKKYFEQYGRLLLMDYVQQELERKERVVISNDEWVVLVPYWAVWPFETILVPLQSVQRLPELNHTQQTGLADILKRLLVKYDNLFETSFPYSMGWHGAPIDGRKNEHWLLHAHFYPPLLRSATVKKFMVGYEMLAEPQRDITAEQAADRLRSLSEIHYKLRD